MARARSVSAPWTAFDLLTGLGSRAWTYSCADPAAAQTLLGRVAAWPSVATEAASGVPVRNRLGVLSSPFWGSLVTPTYERFRVREGDGADVLVEQSVAPGFAVLGVALVVGSYVAAIIGCVAAINGTTAALVALAAPIFFRLAWFETTRESARQSFVKFLASGATPSVASRRRT